MSKRPTSYDITHGLQPAFAWLDTCEQAYAADPSSLDAQQALADAQADVDALLDGAPHKGEGLLYYAEQYEARAAFEKGLAAAATERRKRHEKRATWLRQRALDMTDAYCEATGEDGIALPGGRVLRVAERHSKRVEITDMDAIPDDYVRVTRAPNKVAIGKSLKSGVPVAGAEMVATVTRRAEVK